MIGILPRLYKDELLYSFLSRYSVMSKYGSFRGVAEDLYIHSLNKPNILLFNALTKDLLEKLYPQATLTDIVLENTMFKWFARFARNERREQAYKAAIDMNTKVLYDRLPICHNNNRFSSSRYLRYCPLCSTADREEYGETYFRVYHQIPELNICPIHKCYLQPTNISLSGSTTPAFITAEEVVPSDNKILSCECALEREFADYLFEVVHLPFSIDNKEEIKDYLCSYIQSMGYIRNNGDRDMIKLTEDFNSFYLELGVRRELWELQKILTGYCSNSYEVSLFAYFLNISPRELCDFTLS